MFVCSNIFFNIDHPVKGQVNRIWCYG